MQITPQNASAEMGAMGCLVEGANIYSVPITEEHFAGPDHRFVGPFSEQKAQRTDEQRFARTGFAGNGIQSGSKNDFRLFKEGEIH